MNIPLTVCLIFFATAMGGCVGSFLNVVVWRLPNGLSLVKPGSFCPKCRHPIRFYDNIPVFGWLFLRGKCRDCHAPISPRYPLIEFICAGIACFFAVLVFVFDWTGPPGLFRWEGFHEVREALAAFERGETYFAPSLETTMLKGLLFTAACSVFFYLQLAVGLIEWDGNKTPRMVKYFIALFLLAVCARGFFDRALIEPLAPGCDTRELYLLYGAALLFGAILSWLVGIVCRSDFLAVWLLTLLSALFNPFCVPFIIVLTLIIVLTWILYSRWHRKRRGFNKNAPCLALFAANAAFVITTLWG